MLLISPLSHTGTLAEKNQAVNVFRYRRVNVTNAVQCTAAVSRFR